MRVLKKERKGFTILELLAAVVIVGIIATLAIIAINRYVLQGHNVIDNQIEKQLILATKNYYSDNKTKFINIDEKGVVVWYTTLNANNYISNDLVDSNGNSCAKSYVVVKKDKSKYSYTGCIICDNDGYNNTKDKKECSESLDNTIYCQWTDPNGNKLNKTYLGVKKNNQVTLKLTCKGKGIKFVNGSTLDVDNMISSELGNLEKLHYLPYHNSKKELVSFTSNIKYTALPNSNGNGAVSFNKNSAYVVDNSGQKVPNVLTSYDGIVIDGKGPSCTLSGPYKDSSLKTSVKAVKDGSVVYYSLVCKDDNNVNGSIEKSGFKSSDSINELNIVSKPKNDAKEKSAIISVSVKATKGSSSKFNLTYKKDQLFDNYDNGNDEVSSSIKGSSSTLVIDDEPPTCTFTGPALNATYKTRKSALNIVDEYPNDYVYYELKCTDEGGIDSSTFKFSDIQNNGFSRIEQSDTMKSVENNGVVIGYKYDIMAYENPNAVPNTTKATLKYNKSNLSDSVGNKGEGTIESSPVIMIDNNAIPSCNITYSGNNDGSGTLTGVMSDKIGLKKYAWSTEVGEPDQNDYIDINGTSNSVTDKIFKSGTYYLHMINELGLPGYCQLESEYIVINAPGNPEIEASDGKSSGDWHKKDYKLTAKGSNSGVVYHIGTNKNNLSSSSTEDVDYETKGTIYYAEACWRKNTDICSETVQYKALLDKTPPTCTLTMRKFSGFLNNDGSIPSKNDEGEYEDDHWTQYGVKISMSCSDNKNGSGLKSRQITKPGGRDDLGKWTAITSAEGDGEHVVTATAEDIAGNTFTKSVTVKRDTTAPVLEISIVPEDKGQRLCKSKSVIVTCTDERSGISAMTAGDYKTQAVSKEETLKNAPGGSGKSVMKQEVKFSASGSRYVRAGCVDGALNGTWTGDVYGVDAYYSLPKSRTKTKSSDGYRTESDCLDANDECESRYRRTKYTNGKAQYSWEWVQDRTSQDTTKKGPVTWCKASTACEYYGTSKGCNETIANASTNKGKRRCRNCTGGNGEKVDYTLDECKLTGYSNYNSDTDYPTSCTESGTKGETESYTACSGSASWYVGYKYSCSW